MNLDFSVKEDNSIFYIEGCARLIHTNNIAFPAVAQKAMQTGKFGAT